MQVEGYVAFSPFCLIEIRLILVNEPLCGRAGVDEDHAHDILRPPLRVDPRL